MLRGHGVVRFVVGTCAWCHDGFTLDRLIQPWARSRTCSERCAKKVANYCRTPSNCRHCAMVEAYRLARDTQVREKEVACGDEEAHVWTFREWLIECARERRAHDEWYNDDSYAA